MQGSICAAAAQEEYRIFFFGEKGVGKSTLIRKYLGLSTKNLAPSFGFNLYHAALENLAVRKSICLVDVAGQEVNNIISEKFLSQAQGLTQLQNASA